MTDYLKVTCTVKASSQYIRRSAYVALRHVICDIVAYDGSQYCEAKRNVMVLSIMEADDDLEIVLLLTLYYLRQRRKKKKRSIWVRPIFKLRQKQGALLFRYIDEHVSAVF